MRIMQKKRRFPDDFGLRSFFIQEPFQTKRATSVVARVIFCFPALLVGGFTLNDHHDNAVAIC